LDDWNFWLRWGLTGAGSGEGGLASCGFTEPSVDVIKDSEINGKCGLEDIGFKAEETAK
jgi:hypothetical protein